MYVDESNEAASKRFSKATTGFEATTEFEKSYEEFTGNLKAANKHDESYEEDEEPIVSMYLALFGLGMITI